MRAGDLRAGLIAPLLVYVAVMVFASPFPRTSLLFLGVGVSAVPLLALPIRKAGSLSFVPWAAALGAVAVLVATGTPFPPHDGTAVGLGLLVGLPLLLLGALLRWRDSLAASVGVATVGLAGGTFEFAVFQALPSTGTQTVGAWAEATRDVIATQWANLSGATGVSAPLGFLGNSLYDLLGLFAVMGLLFSMLLSSERLAGGRAEDAPSGPLDASVGFAVQQLPASAYALSGIVPASVTLLALVLVVLSNAFGGPTLLGVTIAASVVLAILFALGVNSPRAAPVVSPARVR